MNAACKNFVRLVTISIFFIPLKSHAWGLTGHRVVGEIAQSYLTAKAKEAIKKILGHETLAMASNWADFIKSEPFYNYLSPWHYINLPDNFSEKNFYEALQKDTATDAYTKLNFLITQLKSAKTPTLKKRMYLRLLIHIVGDAHQPMHVSRQEDEGGNKIRLTWFGAPSNLHRVWDENLLESQNLSYTEYTNAINFTTLQQRKLWQQQPVSKWFFESYTISQKLYAEINQPEPKLSYRYIYDHITTANTQLLKGGVRLAGLLNRIFM